MAGFSDYLENAVLNQIFGSQAYSAPATIYVGLSSSLPTDSGGNITEPSGNGYARVAVTNNTTNWPVTSTGSKTNGVPITFASATGAWGSVSYVVLFDSLTSGNFLAQGTLSTSKSPTAGDVLSYGTGTLTINLD